MTSNTFNLNNFNSFIEQARQTITCDSTCQKKKGEQSLKQEYLNAQTNLATAPDKLTLAEKNYIVFSEGELGYNTFEDNLINNNAEKITTLFTDNFEKEIIDITSNNFTYSNLLINFKNVVDLYFQYKKENIYLKNELKQMTNDVVINDRKTYYENQGIEFLQYIYYYSFVFIYSFLVIIYIVISFVYTSHQSVKYRVFILIGLIILPFISSYIISLIINIVLIIYKVLPKNSYLNI
jgi:hypothetical protein